MKMPTPISVSTHGRIIFYTPWGDIRTKRTFKNTWIERVILAWLDWRFDFNNSRG